MESNCVVIILRKLCVLLNPAISNFVDVVASKVDLATVIVIVIADCLNLILWYFVGDKSFSRHYASSPMQQQAGRANEVAEKHGMAGENPPLQPVEPNPSTKE
jgi:hypothetical protein